MHDSHNPDPVALLRAMEASCRAHGLPGTQKVTSEWSGIGLRIGELRLVTPLVEAVEILVPPEMARVPMSKPWVLGLASIRGRLLPVIDLNGYLKGSPTRITPKTRLLVVDHDGIFTGLLVDEVFGMKHFMKDEYVDNESHVEDCIAPYCKYGYHRDGQYWVLISLHALAGSSRFLQAAV